MNQTLHIFRKDTRRFWPEILASVVIELLFALQFPEQWHPENFGTTRPYLVIACVCLIPASWWLLIARAIHAEAPVGDNQFWLTRPYEWKSLLAAKAIFIGVWVYLPYLLAQLLLMAEGGLSPWGHGSDWAAVLALISGLAIVPLAAIAAVTANFARMTVTLFGVLIAVLSGTFVAVSYKAGYEALVPYPHHMTAILILILGGIAVTTLQYATRRVWLARGVLLGVAALAVASVCTLSAMQESQIDHQYPAPDAATAAPVHLAFAQDAQRPPSFDPSERPGKVYIEIPIDFSGVSANTVVRLDNIKVSLDASDGSSWTAPWWFGRESPVLPGTTHSRIKVMLPREIYDRYKSAPVMLHLAFALTELQVAGQSTVDLSQSDPPVPGLGVCEYGSSERITDLTMCHDAFSSPLVTLATVRWSKSPCSGPQPPQEALPVGMQWHGNPSSDTFSTGPIATTIYVLRPWPRMDVPNGLHGMQLCPGTPMHVTSYEATGRTRAYLYIPGFQLPNSNDQR